MRRAARVLLGMVLGIAGMSGCRTATKVTQVPRVDLELPEGGNRGYLVGTPPATSTRKSTREMIGTTIEIPSFYRPTASLTGPQAAGPESIPPASPTAPAASTWTAEEEQTQAAPPVAYDTYVVQKGESLWSIAAKPEMYGKAGRWRRIFDANRERLHDNPNRVRVGMSLKIPRGEQATSSTTYDDEGVTFTK